MLVCINLLTILTISIACAFIIKYIPNKYARINRRIDNFIDSQQVILKYHLLSLLMQMSNLKSVATIHKEYEAASNIQKNIEEVKEIRKNYE